MKDDVAHAIVPIALAFNDRMNEAQHLYREYAAFLGTLRFCHATTTRNMIPVNQREMHALQRSLAAEVAQLVCSQWDLAFDMASIGRAMQPAPDGQRTPADDIERAAHMLLRWRPGAALRPPSKQASLGTRLRGASPKGLVRALMRGRWGEDSGNGRPWRAGMLRWLPGEGSSAESAEWKPATEFATLSLPDRHQRLRDAETALARLLELDDHTLDAELVGVPDPHGSLGVADPRRIARALRPHLGQDPQAALTGLVELAEDITAERAQQRAARFREDLEAGNSFLVEDLLHRLARHEGDVERIARTLRAIRRTALRWLDGLGPGIPSIPRAHRQDHTFQYTLQQSILGPMLDSVQALVRAMITPHARRPPIVAITVAYVDSHATEVHEDHGILGIECPLYHLDSPRRLVDLCHEAAHGCLPALELVFGEGVFHPAVERVLLTFGRWLNDHAPPEWAWSYCQALAMELLADVVAMTVAGPHYATSLMQLLLGSTRFAPNGGEHIDPMLRVAALWRGARSLTPATAGPNALDAWDKHMRALETTYLDAIDNSQRRRADRGEPADLLLAEHYRAVIDEAATLVSALLQRLPNLFQPDTPERNALAEHYLRAPQPTDGLPGRLTHVTERWSDLRNRAEAPTHDAPAPDPHSGFPQCLREFHDAPAAKGVQAGQRIRTCALHFVWDAWVGRQLGWSRAGDVEALLFKRTADLPLMLFLSVLADAAAPEDDTTCMYLGLGQPIDLVFVDRHGTPHDLNAGSLGTPLIHLLNHGDAPAEVPGALGWVHVVGVMDFACVRSSHHTTHLLHALVRHPPAARMGEPAYVRPYDLEWLTPTDWQALLKDQDGRLGELPVSYQDALMTCGANNTSPFLFMTQIPIRTTSGRELGQATKERAQLDGTGLKGWLTDRFLIGNADAASNGLLGICRSYGWSEFVVWWEPRLWPGTAALHRLPGVERPNLGTETTTLIRWTPAMTAIHDEVKGALDQVELHADVLEHLEAAVRTTCELYIGSGFDPSEPPLLFGFRAWVWRNGHQARPKFPRRSSLHAVRQRWNAALSPARDGVPSTAGDLWLWHELGEADVSGILQLHPFALRETDQVRRLLDAVHGDHDLARASLAAWLFLLVNQGLLVDLDAFEVVSRLGVPERG
jgi:hypothetical protein